MRHRNPHPRELLLPEPAAPKKLKLVLVEKWGRTRHTASTDSQIPTSLTVHVAKPGSPPRPVSVRALSLSSTLAHLIPFLGTVWVSWAKFGSLLLEDKDDHTPCEDELGLLLDDDLPDVLIRAYV
ncbi:hypothetical protein B0H14DRAFT_3502081 [Mycena olivaceomarginata]|nr:hypothetical protein B0H14DRAFT_3502081 [Mycena olivaceomarginata]